MMLARVSIDDYRVGSDPEGRVDAGRTVDQRGRAPFLLSGRCQEEAPLSGACDLCDSLARDVIDLWTMISSS